MYNKSGILLRQVFERMLVGIFQSVIMSGSELKLIYLMRNVDIRVCEGNV